MKNEIHFYGGEPLLNKRLMIEIAKYVREKGFSKDKINLKVVSNGFEIDEKIIGIFSIL